MVRDSSLTRYRPDSHAPQGGTLARTRILVVEDDIHVLETYKLFLEIEGYLVITATNGREALEALRTDEPLPALILLDLMMPVMNGWQFLEERQADPRLADIPVIAITSARFPESPPGAMQTILKPVDIPVLLRLIGEHAREPRPPVLQPAPPPKPSSR